LNVGQFIHIIKGVAVVSTKVAAVVSIIAKATIATVTIATVIIAKVTIATVTKI
jgi:hypothetical protein